MSDLNQDRESAVILLARLDERVATLGARLEQVERDLREVKEQAQRWKGAFVLVLAFGGLIGWLANIWASVFK